MTPEELLADLNALCDGWVQEYRFYPGRRCAFDYAHPRQLTQGLLYPSSVIYPHSSAAEIAVEIEGGVWMSVHGGKSRHFHGSGAIKDMEKYNAAERRGWTVFHYCSCPKITAKTQKAREKQGQAQRDWKQRILKDVRVVLTGIEDGQRTLEQTVQGKLLSDKIGWSMTETSIRT